MRFGPSGAVDGFFERRKRRIPEKVRRARAASATRTLAFRDAAGAFTCVPLVIAAGPDACESANAMSFADWNRFPRSFSRQCWTIWSRAGGMFRPGRGELRRLLLQDRRHRVGRRVPPERLPARKQLVEDRAEREDVRPVVDGQPAHLLGRHVADRPHHDARLRVLRLRRKTRLLAGPRLCGALRQSEVEDFQVTVVRDDEVFGLEVAVNDPLLVGRRQSAGDLAGEGHRLLRRDPSRELLAERLAFEELHDEDVASRRGRGERGDFFE